MPCFLSFHCFAFLWWTVHTHTHKLTHSYTLTQSSWLPHSCPITANTCQSGATMTPTKTGQKAEQDAKREAEGKGRLTEWWPWPSQIVLSVKGSTGLLGLRTGGHTYANAAVDPCPGPGRLDAYLKGFKFTAKGVRRTASDCHGPNKSVLPVVFPCPPHPLYLSPHPLSLSLWVYCSFEIQYLHFTIYFNTYTPHCTASCHAGPKLFVTFYQHVM